ncbi:cob(I)yrinic acid a,c-diamide adenosyltransferase [soil metagenome]
MGNRLSKIYTKTGDQGTTGLGDGSRVAKNDVRVEAYGTVDELNSAIGIVLAFPQLPTLVQESLIQIQHDLFDLGGELCIPNYQVMTAVHSHYLEQILDTLNSDLPPLKEFILPGGSPAAAACHLARAICRRAERRVVTLAQEQTINEHVVIYLNRLSDLLFVMARVLARIAGGIEVLWQHERKK